MSRLLDIQDKLLDTSAAIARFEKEFAAAPTLDARLMLASFEKRKRQLEAEFFAISAKAGIDVCSYRFFSDFVRPTVTPLCTALAQFQELYSLVYESVKSGLRRKTKRLTPEIIDESSFFFGYSFAGSVGVMMTFDSHRLPLFENDLNQSMNVVFDLAEARTSEEVLERGKRVGIPAIRALHRWAAAHVSYALGADIEWRRGANVLKGVMLQVEDLKVLMAAIDSTTEIIEDDEEVQAKLAGADVSKRTFHLELPDGRDIKGTFSQFISTSQTFEVGATYAATVRKRVRVYYSTEAEEDVSYQLLTATAMRGE